MKDKWLDELRESLSDFEMDAPDGLWESLGVERPLPVAAPVSKGVWRRRWIIAAAVISVLIIGSGIIMWLAQTEPIKINEAKYAQTNGKSLFTTPETNLTGNQKHTLAANESPSLNIKQSQKTSIQNYSEKTKEPDIHVSDEETTLSLLDTIKTENQKPNDQAISSADKTKKEKEYVSEGEKTFYANISPKNRKGTSDYSDKFAINMSASGIGNSTEGKSYWIPGQNGNDLFFGSSLETTKIIHHQPVRVGMTLQYNFSNRIGIESGLVYSSLGSDISTTRDNLTATGSRSLHYVGIPLNVKISAWSWKFIDLYISSGVTGEKCVSNKFEVKSIANDLSLDAFSSQKEKPFQWSVNAAAGIQLKATPNIGIFAEPGVSYYFDDGSSISTIYKDRPCNFNLNLGIRFNLNP